MLHPPFVPCLRWTLRMGQRLVLPMRIIDVTNGIADKNETQYAQAHHHPWRHPEPGSLLQCGQTVGLLDQIAPTGCRRLNAQTQVTETCFQENGTANTRNYAHQDDPHQVGHNVAKDDPVILNSDGVGRQDEVRLSYGENLPAEETTDTTPIEKGNGQEQVGDPWPQHRNQDR